MDAAAGEFIAFKSIYQDLPDIDDVIANPTTAKVPTSTSVIFAVIGALTVRVTKENFASIVKYANRLPTEYGVLVMKDALAKDRTLIQSQTFTDWSVKNADVLL